MRNSTSRTGILALALAMALIALSRSAPLFHALFPDLARPVYTRASFAELLLAHVLLVAISTIGAAMIAISAAVAVSRPSGREFNPVANAAAAVSQTFPPVAVLAVLVPTLGYGWRPALVALTLYAMFPIFQATIGALSDPPRGVIEAARGMGFSTRRILWAVELPLAAPAIVAGVRIAALTNIGTAAIASSVGALSLGSPILEGLSTSNLAYVIQGAILITLLAVTIDQAFGLAASRFVRI